MTAMVFVMMLSFYYFSRHVSTLLTPRTPSSSAPTCQSLLKRSLGSRNPGS